MPVGGATSAAGFDVRGGRPPNGAADAEGQAHDGGDGDPERRSAHDVERVVGADVDPTDHDPEHDRPRHQAPPAGQERRDHPGQPGHEHGVTGDEALAGGRHVAAQVHVGTDRRAGSLPADDRLDPPLRHELEHRDQERGNREAPSVHHQGDDRDDQPHGQRADLLQRPRRAVQPSGQIVDAVEGPLLGARDATVTDGDHAQGEHGQPHQERGHVAVRSSRRRRPTHSDIVRHGADAVLRPTATSGRCQQESSCWVPMRRRVEPGRRDRRHQRVHTAVGQAGAS